MMSMALTFTSVDISAFAMEITEKNKDILTILEVEKLADEIKVQELDIGALEKDIEFPKDLDVNIQETKDGSNVLKEDEYKTDIPVTWELDKEKSSKEEL